MDAALRLPGRCDGARRIVTRLACHYGYSPSFSGQVLCEVCEHLACRSNIRPVESIQKEDRALARFFIGPSHHEIIACDPIAGKPTALSLRLVQVTNGSPSLGTVDRTSVDAFVDCSSEMSASAPT